jgi:hypothetical protein
VNEPEVRALIDDLADLPAVEVIVTSRPGVPLPPDTNVVEMPTMSEAAAGSLLTGLGIEQPDHERLVELAAGNWLVLNLAAHQQLHNPSDASDTRAALYARVIEEAIERQGRADVIAVLTALSAVAGPGPLIPISILADAVPRLGGSSTRSRLYAVLGDRDLYSVLARANATSPNEHVGVFHATFIQALREREDVVPSNGHQALLEAIEELAPLPESDGLHDRA